MKSLCVSILFLLLCANSSLAQEKAEEEGSAAAAKLKAAAQIKFADANADGKLTLVELRKARTAFLKANIEASAQKDVERGKRLKDEYRDLLAVQDFLAADADNDHSLTTEQLAAYIALDSENKRWRLSDLDIETVAQEKWSENWDWSINGVDTDGDGHISKSEGGEDLKDEKNQKEFDAADLDGDGALSRFEYMKTGIDRFKEYAKSKVEKARAEFRDKIIGDDPWRLYKKKGRKWTWKCVTNPGGKSPAVNYACWEVVDVSEKSAKVEYVVLDAEKKPMPGPGKQTVEIKFETPPKGMPKDTAPEILTETIKVEAGEFECYISEQKEEFGTTKTWVSCKYPGLNVKQTSEIFSMELVEFFEGE